MEPATATIVPTLDGFAEGFVVFRFLKTAAHLDLGENDVLRIYKGTWPFGEVLHTIDRSNQEQYRGNAVVVEGKATLVYTGAANNDLRFWYYTGDYTFTTHLGQPMAIWSDFIEPNSHVVVDDNYMDGAEFLPVIFAHFDEQKNYVSSSTAFCLQTEADVPTLYGALDSDNVATYPGQISYQLEHFEDYPFHEIPDFPDKRRVAAGIMYLADRANSITDPEQLAEIQLAIWTLQGQRFDYNEWYNEASVNTIEIDQEPVLFSITTLSSNQATAVVSKPIYVEITMVGGILASNLLTLDIPQGVIIQSITGGSLQGDNEIFLYGDKLTLELISAEPIKTRLGAEWRYANGIRSRNLKVYMPCDPTYQPFIAVNDSNRAYPNLLIDLEWYASTLPVQLASFELYKENDRVKLQWETTEELQFSHFEVERSVDGREWVKVDRVNAKGKGIYTAEDGEIRLGTIFYRLKMVDQDGSFGYSPTRSIALMLDHIIAVYPNPVSYSLRINTESVENVSLYNLNGVKIADSNGGASLDVSALPDGLYLGLVKYKNGTQKIQKIVVRK